LNVSVLEAL